MNNAIEVNIESSNYKTNRSLLGLDTTRSTLIHLWHTFYIHVFIDLYSWRDFFLNLGSEELASFKSTLLPSRYSS